MKKILSIWLCISCIMMSCLFSLSYKVQAEDDFEINERQYMERCKASDMSKKDVEICASFNEYLKSKNSQTKANIDSLNGDIDETESNIQQLKAEIEAIDQQIEAKQVEIAYASDNINALAISILNKENILKDRLYDMQTYVNSNFFVDFILGASNFSDLFSRIEGVNEITEYDRELISDLASEKAESESQKQLLEDSKASLDLLQSAQVARHEELNQSLTDLRSTVGYLEEEVTLTQSSIDAVASVVSASQISIAEEEELKKKLEEEANNSQPVTPPDNSSSGGSSGGSEVPDDSNDPVTPPNNNTGSNLGSQAVLVAMNQKGSPYVWGGKGQYITESLISGLASYYGWSWYSGLESYYDSGVRAFDCSGLTSWAYAQVGVTIGLSTYSQQVNGYAVSWDEMIPGDLILFDWDGDGQTDHVGMYAGSGMMVHTSTPNDGLGVHTVNLNASSSWRNNCYTIRRVV